MSPTLLLQVTEQGQRVDTAIGCDWKGMLCASSLGQTAGMSGQTPVWVMKTMSAHEWVAAWSSLCSIVTFTPDSTMRQEGLRVILRTKPRSCIILSFCHVRVCLADI